MIFGKIMRTTVGLAISILIFAPIIQAKKAPDPESVVNKPFVRPSAGAPRAMTDQYDNNGFASRLYFPNFQSSFKSTDQIVNEYLAQNQSLLGIKSDGTDLSLFSIRHSIAGYHYRYQQVVDGVPVFGRWLVVNIRFDNVISSVISDYVHNINITTIPTLTSKNAEELAINEIDVKSFSGEVTSELVIYANDTEPVLCWKVLIPAEKPRGDWQVFVDANNGRIVDKDNTMVFVDGTGYMFNPNPVVSEQNMNLADSSNRNYPALTNARRVGSLRELNAPQGGYYFLSGPFANTGPTSNRAHLANPDSFFYNRNVNQFEEVTAYFHIDSCARYYQALGFTDIMQYSINLNVGGTTDDNSWFQPSSHTITYGTGGVDDAEDGDVIVHEYGHATQYNQVPGWGQLEEGGAMGEGFGDYLTVGFFHSVSGGWHEAQVFDWDGNPRDNFWPGRRVDGNKHYPQDMDGEVHDDGEIWSRCLWDMQNYLGNDLTVRLVLESHFNLTPRARFIDGANAIVQADMDLYNGVHLMSIGRAFFDRGIFTELPFHLSISHTPLTDTEDSTGTFDLFAILDHTFPIDSVLLYYRFDTTSEWSTGILGPLAPPPPNRYAASIPGPSHQSMVYYYLRAVDSLGITATLPERAPASTFSFYVGIDTVLPTITHQRLADIPSIMWPPQILARVTDNIVVESVTVEFMVNNGPINIAPLTRSDTSDLIWSGIFTGSVQPDDSISYRIKAMDQSSRRNLNYNPIVGYNSFKILNMQQVTYMRDGFAIPDYGASVFDTLNVPDHFSIFDVDVFVDIDHPRIGDLIVWIRDPLGRLVILHNRTGGDGDSIVGWYGDDLQPDGTGNLDVFRGDSSQGNWVFYVSDRVAGGETGVLNSWGLRIVGTGQRVGINEDRKILPEAFTLNQNYPNPFNPSTNISFNLPQSGDVKLEIFDLLGRRVSTLIDNNLIAGPHILTWDGRNGATQASSGIYFARLTAGNRTAVIRMSLIK